MSTTTARPSGSRPADTAQLRLDPSSRQQRRPRTSWIALGLLVLVAFGLFGAVTVARVAAREPVLVMAQPIERGEPLTPDHLMVIDVGIDGDVAVVAAADRDAIVGLTATTALDVGTLLAPSQFSDGPSVAPGDSVVGLALAPGEYPTTDLRPGDVVAVIRTPGTNPAADADLASTVLAERAEIFAVEALSETAATLMVSIVVPADITPDVAASASAGRVRLALVGGP